MDPIEVAVIVLALAVGSGIYVASKAARVERDRPRFGDHDTFVEDHD